MFRGEILRKAADPRNMTTIILPVMATYWMSFFRSSQRGASWWFFYTNNINIILVSWRQLCNNARENIQPLITQTVDFTMQFLAISLKFITYPSRKLVEGLPSNLIRRHCLWRSYNFKFLDGHRVLKLTESFTNTDAKSTDITIFNKSKLLFLERI